MKKKSRSWKKKRRFIWQQSTKSTADSSGNSSLWITMTRWSMPIICFEKFQNFLHIFRRNTLISAWMRHRIHRKSSMPSLHCWHRNPRIFLWWEMKIRAFMDSVPLTRRHCWNLSIIIRERKCCLWKKISVPMETLFWQQTGLSRKTSCVMRNICVPPKKENRT